MAIREGFPPDWVTDLDLTSFDELVKSVLRVSYQDRVESAWCAMIAAQGNKKGMERFLRPLVKAIKEYDPRQGPQDGAAFRRMLGGLRYRKPEERPAQGRPRSPLQPRPDKK